MSRREDLEGHIRESYGIVREYEDVIRTSDRPEEKLRARRAIADQWALIEGYVGEYRVLADEGWPRDIAEIAARFEPGADQEPKEALPGGPAGTVFSQDRQRVGQQINVAGDYYAGGAAGTGGPARGGGGDATGTGWSTERVRQLLLAAFSDTELMTLCFDHYPEVYQDLSPAMSKGDKVQHLLEHCVRYGQVDELLGLVRERNRYQYERFEPRQGKG